MLLRDEGMQSDTHVRCESWKDTSAERKPKLEEGGGAAERMMGSHAGSGHSERGGARGERRSRGGQGEGSEGLIEEERSGTRLTLRPCRMHKPGTRDKKSSQKQNTSKRAHKGNQNNKTTIK